MTTGVGDDVSFYPYRMALNGVDLEFGFDGQVFPGVDFTFEYQVCTINRKYMYHLHSTEEGVTYSHNQL